MDRMSGDLSEMTVTWTGHPLNPPFLKIALLLLASVSVHISLSPPNPPASPKHCITKKSLFERCVRWVTFCSKMMVWMATISDAIGTYSMYYHRYSELSLEYSACNRNITAGCSQIAKSSLPHPSQSLLMPSPYLILGTISVLLGALLRLWCFRSLGPFFTFELSIHPSHHLVTSGPYNFVRHPSYTGIYLTLLGATAVGITPGSWLYECWLTPSGCESSTQWTPWLAFGSSDAVASRTMCWLVQVLVYALIGFWLLKVWYALRSTNRRLHVEDVELHRVFGETWEAYAQRVRWKLLPGIF